MEKHEKVPSALDPATPREAYRMVQVEDEADNRYEATYPKRARGLVKNGRARFKDESQTTIILTCPPKQQNDLEDTNMNEHIDNTVNTAVETVAAEVSTDKYTYEYALKQIERIAVETEHIHQAIAELGGLENEGVPTGGSADAIARGIADVVRCRETTAQRLIDFYERMYFDLAPRNTAKQADRVEFMEWVRSCIGSAERGQELPDFEKLWKMFN